MTTRPKIRAAQAEELSELSQLCLRSKAHWGYDAPFLAACVPVLTLSEDDLDRGLLVVAEQDGVPAGIAQLAGPPGEMEIDRFFVDPPFMGMGIGQALFAWCIETARALNQTQLLIEADPGAASFYERMGATRVGQVPSGAIPGRMLPLLQVTISRM